MKDLKQIEKLMMLKARRENAEYHTAYISVVKHYGFEDDQNNTNHCKILHELYNLPKRRNTLEGIATLVGVSDNSLRRYRNTYADMFCHYLRLAQKEKAIG